MFISVFNCGGGRGVRKNQEAEVVFLSGPWQIWGEEGSSWVSDSFPASA